MVEGRRIRPLAAVVVPRRNDAGNRISARTILDLHATSGPPCRHGDDLVHARGRVLSDLFEHRIRKSRCTSPARRRRRPARVDR